MSGLRCNLCQALQKIAGRADVAPAHQRGTEMTKWVGVLGGGAAAAVVGAGLYVSGILTPTQTPPEPEPQQAVAPLPDDSG